MSTSHFALGACAAVALSILSSAAGVSPEDGHGDKPALIVVLVVDQMRADYVERYGRHWRGGLRRLVNEGAWFDHAAYPYANTMTCVGHATIGTGCFPLHHGIVLNQWYDRAAADVVGCGHDEAATTIGPLNIYPGAETPHRLLAPTLAERVKQQGGRAVAISVKACAAIGLAGRAADAVLWFGGNGTFVTSSAYGFALPPFVLDTLATRPINADCAQAWPRVLPDDAYLGEDGALAERPPAGWTNLFPHPLGCDDRALFLQRWIRTPLSDAYIGLLARAAIDGLELGNDDRTDFLAVSFSALDLIGHPFGPDSHEIQDALARLDQTVGTLLHHLDDKVGPRRYVLALAGDHGVAPIPEQLRAKGVDAGRLSAAATSDCIERALTEHLGAGPHVAAILGTEIYLKPGVWDQLSASPAALQAVKAAVAGLPGIERLLHRDQLVKPADGDRVQRAAALSYFPGRSGDLMIIPKKHWVMTRDATSHGTPHDYDQRTPLVLFGAGVRPGRYPDCVSPADIAPTFAVMAELAFPDADGRTLARALLPRAGSSR